MAQEINSTSTVLEMVLLSLTHRQPYINKSNFKLHVASEGRNKYTFSI
uniref:Uncharacterized protein n=1 Tax=Arundo donax TaxID=35708 RepID=A0A0A8Y8B7_ARUDO